MTQVLHIFRKDVRRLWRETATLNVLLVAYAWETVRRWHSEFSFEFWSEWLALLVPLAWIFLILRCVQEESLVGDRQFWVTRPHEWPKLLAAKLLFVLVFINVPLFVIDVVLLAKAGFPPASYLPGLLWLQLLWTLFLFLPAFALGAITSNIGQAVLVVIGVILYLVLISELSREVPQPFSLAGDPPVILETSLGLATAAAVVLLQYSRRRTRKSRLFVVGLAITVPLIAAVTPYSRLIDRAYPPAAAGHPPPVQLSLGPKEKPAPAFAPSDSVAVVIPLDFSGLQENSIVTLDGALTTIEGPGGERWNSHWRYAGNYLLPERAHTQVDLTIDRVFFDRVKNTPVNVRISFAATDLHELGKERVVTSPSGFAVPGNGRCWYRHGRRGDDIACLFPLKQPFATFKVSAGEMTCPQNPDATGGSLPPDTIGYGWLGHSASQAELGISPVATTELFVWDWGVSDQARTPRLICPGTPLRFSMLEEAGRMRIELRLDGIRLADYQADEMASGAVGAGFYLPRP